MVTLEKMNICTALFQLKQNIEHPSCVRPTVDIIPKKDQRIPFSIVGYTIKQCGKLRSAAMNIAYSKDFSLGHTLFPYNHFFVIHCSIARAIIRSTLAAIFESQRQVNSSEQSICARPARTSLNPSQQSFRQSTSVALSSFFSSILLNTLR